MEEIGGTTRGGDPPRTPGGEGVGGGDLAGACPIRNGGNAVEGASDLCCGHPFEDCGRAPFPSSASGCKCGCGCEEGRDAFSEDRPLNWSTDADPVDDVVTFPTMAAAVAFAAASRPRFSRESLAKLDLLSVVRVEGAGGRLSPGGNVSKRPSPVALLRTKGVPSD